MERQIELRIGPVPSDIALAWIAHARQLVAALAAYRGALSISVRDEMLELCDSVLVTWETLAAKGEVFDWTASMTHEVIQVVIEQWLQIGALTDDELALLDVTWAPEWTRPMADALTRAVIAIVPSFDQTTKRRFVELLEASSD